MGLAGVCLNGDKRKKTPGSDGFWRGSKPGKALARLTLASILRISRAACIGFPFCGTIMLALILTLLQFVANPRRAAHRGI